MKSTKIGPNIGFVPKLNLDLAILQPAHLDPAKRAPLIETEQNLFHIILNLQQKEVQEKRYHESSCEDVGGNKRRPADAGVVQHPRLCEQPEDGDGGSSKT